MFLLKVVKGEESDFVINPNFVYKVFINADQSRQRYFRRLNSLLQMKSSETVPEKSCENMSFRSSLISTK